MVRSVHFALGAVLVTVLMATGVVPAQAATGRGAPRASAAAAATRKPVVHPLGLTVPTTRKAPARRARRMLAAPASVDLSAWTVQPGDQGLVGSCTSWAIGYSMMGYYANRLGAPTDFAPMYLYSQIHASNAPDGGGSSSRGAYSVLQSQGIDTQADYTQGNYDWRTPPTDSERANAAQYVAGPSTVLYQGYAYGGGWGASTKDAIEQQLAAGHPVALGIPIYTSFDALDSRDWTFDEADVARGTYRGDHMVLVIGYDASGVRIENSWGTSWGQGGYANLGWDFVEQQSTEASTISGFQASSIPAPTVPSIPNAVSTSTTKRTATVTWTPPIADGGSPITGYVATETWGYSGTTADATQTLPASARSATFSGLDASTPYALTIRAVTATARGSLRTVVATTSPATVPGTPTGLVLTPSDDGSSIHVAWTAPEDDGGYSIWQYLVTSPDPGLSGGATYNATTGTLWGAQAGGTYQVAVAAQNGVGTGGTATASITMPLTVPGVPDAGFSSGSSNATISWNPPSRTGGTPITGYRVTAVLADGSTSVRDLGPDARSSVFTDLAAGAATIGVAAVNALGIGVAKSWTLSYSGPSPAYVPVSTPMLRGFNYVDGDFVMTWDPMGIDATNGGWTVDASPVDDSAAVALHDLAVPAGSASYRFHGLTPATQYRFTVTAPTGRALTWAWTIAPAWTGSAPVPIADTTMPTALSVEHRGAGAVLSWDVVGATDGTSGWTVDAIPVDDPRALTFASMTVADGAHRFPFASLTPGTRYRFVVRTPSSRTLQVEWTTPAAAAPAAPAKPGRSATIDRPGAPARVWLSGTGRTRVLHWSAPRSGGPVVRWLVGYRAAGPDKAVQLTRSARSWKASGLHVGRRYRFTVRTVGANGSSAEVVAAVTVKR